LWHDKCNRDLSTAAKIATGSVVLLFPLGIRYYVNLKSGLETALTIRRKDDV